ncbi:MAG: FHA domain-containing protein [Planctomycetota bacterium]|jgi:pSer/pThr/pTyr-binding forkhead associated (FHA) protein|nr:FHA domain-containing protein [Planctomycetota bacterium]
MQLRSRGTNQLIDLADGMTIGRMADCTIQLKDGSISRHHASIEEIDGTMFLVDNGSSNGCFQNGAKVKRCEIRAGDLLTLGAVAFDVVSTASKSRASAESGRAAPSNTAAERARLRHEITGNHRSSGLGDLGQQPFGVKVLAGVVGLAVMSGVFVGIRYLAGSL